MGQEVKKSPIIHRKQFMDGRMTPQELHASTAFPLGAKCTGCGGPPMTSIHSYGEEAEMLKRDPNLLVLLKTDPEKYAQMRTQTKMGYFLRIGAVYACSLCSKQAQKEAARHPSWCFVEIDTGPTPDRLVTGYTGN